MQQTARLTQRQNQTLSPRLQQAVRLLQLSSLDFAQQANDLAGHNPFLESEEPQIESPAGMATAHSQLDRPMPPEEGGYHSPEPAAEAGAPSHDDLAADTSNPGLEHDTWLADGSMPSRHRQDPGMDALALMTVPSSLREHLHGQLDVMPLPLRDRLLAKAVVESLDDDGYLRTPLGEVVREADLAPPAGDDELRIALCRVQALDPAGVGARSVAECLLLQLPAIACPEQRAVAATVVKDHLDCLAGNEIARLARRLAREPAYVEAVCDRIRHLDPRPGWRFDAGQAQYITPDVVVRHWSGRWSVALNPAVVPRVRVNQHYAQLFQRHRNGHDEELATHLQEARWTVRNVEQRFATIIGVARAIVKRQHRFFEFGTLAMKPLALREIADEVGVHESTVSRVTNNKYMSTPLGVFELKYFFSRPMTAASGDTCSPTAIRGLIKELIEAESAQSPLSDVKITHLLAQQGFTVARRTVTKYRQLLRIAPGERRRAVA